MKKLILLSLILLFLIPIIANANIICNDGSESPTCSDCHTGCCSGHNGCTTNVHHYSLEKKKKTKNKGISKIDFVLIVITIVPWLIAFFVAIYEYFKELIKIVIEKIKNILKRRKDEKNK